MKYSRSTAYAGAALLAAAFSQTLAFAALPAPKPGKISVDALKADSWAPVPVIIQFKQNSAYMQDQAMASVQATAGKHLPSVKAVTASLTRAAMETLANNQNVAYISLDRPIGARAAIDSKAEYTTEPINAPAVWSQGYSGTGIGVAVIDSGITPVDDLSAASGPGTRVVYSQSFLPSTTAPAGPSAANDQYGHGTHVAGLIAGNGHSSTGARYYRTFSGVAPSANLINLRVLDQYGHGTDSSVIAAIETAIALKSTYNIRVINLSLGRPVWESYKLDPLCQAVEAAWKAGIVVVAAAGNNGRDQALNAEGYGTIEAPGNDPYVLTVGAMRTMGTASIGDDAIASYSSKGPSFIDQVAKPDIVAPGNLVSSLKFPGDLLAAQNPTFVTPNSYYQNKGNTMPSPDYLPLSGTSMAAGVVSGAVALLLQAEPQLTPDQAKALLMRDAQRAYFPRVSSVTDAATGAAYVSHYDVFTVGAGYLDIQAALNDAANSKQVLPAGTAMSPVAVFDPTSGNTALVADKSSLWGSTILWGAGSVYGQNAFEPQPSSATILWGATADWGASNPASFNALSGASALSGAEDTAGFSALWGASAPGASTILWGASSSGASTILWGAGSTSASTILWGAGTPQAATILWGASGLDSSTILWGASTVGSSTILWGASAPFER